MTFSDDQFGEGCFFGLEGPYGGVSDKRQSLIIYGGNNGKGSGINSNNFLWEVDVKSFIIKNGQIINNDPVPVVFSLFPSKTINQNGIINLPPIGFIALSSEDNQTVEFIAEPGQIFSTQFEFSFDLVDFDPLAVWNLEFIYQSTDEWLFFSFDLNQTKIFVGDSNESIPIENGFLKFKSNRNFSVSDFIIWTDANIFQNTSISLDLPILIESKLPASLTTSKIVKRFAPTAKVDTLLVKVCIRCEAKSQPIIPPNEIGIPEMGVLIAIILSVVGGTFIIVAFVALFTIRFSRKKKRLELETRLPKVIVDRLSDLHPVPDIWIGKKINDGEFGEIYMGTAYSGTTSVILKKLKIDNGELFLKELEILVSLRHPNVVQFYGVGLLEFSDIQDLYLVMEFVENGSVLEWFKFKGKNTLLKDKIDILISAAKGLVYIHSLNLIHGDIAARNILIDSTGKAKITDFGYASWAIKNNYKIDLKQEKNEKAGIKDDIKLPVLWSSPEVLLKSEFSKSSDVWSFGITCYEILTNGNLPFSDIPIEYAYEKITTSEFEIQKPKEIPQDLWISLLYCWIYFPQKRPTMIDIVHALSKFRFSLIGESTHLIQNELDSKIIDKNINKNTYYTDSYSLHPNPVHKIDGKESYELTYIIPKQQIYENELNSQHYTQSLNENNQSQRIYDKSPFQDIKPIYNITPFSDNSIYHKSPNS